MVPLNAVYNNVTIQAGAYMSANGTTLAFSAYGTVTVSGVITMDGHGYAGGTTDQGMQGASPAGAGSKSIQPNGGGGGGGDCDLCGGGGGGYGTAGSPGHHPTHYTNTPAQGGTPYGDSSLSSLYPGSGGGSSSLQMCACRWADGGAGGGIIEITAAAITVTGRVSANGMDGQSRHEATGDSTYGGGGGGGGSILLVAGSFSGSSNVTATGGAGGVGTVGSTGEDISGGAGGDGRIRFAH
jgi:hypothetical protein